MHQYHYNSRIQARSPPMAICLSNALCVWCSIPLKHHLANPPDI